MSHATTNGDEILLWTNSADPTPICENAIVKIRLSDAHQTCLISLDWSLAVHVSAPDTGGWFFMETYAPADPAPDSEALEDVHERNPSGETRWYGGSPVGPPSEPPLYQL